MQHKTQINEAYSLNLSEVYNDMTEILFDFCHFIFVVSYQHEKNSFQFEYRTEPFKYDQGKVSPYQNNIKV